MKTFGKLITLILVGAISLVNTSCSKTEEEVVTLTYYQFDKVEWDCLDGCEKTLLECQGEIIEVKDKYNGTSFNESDLISDMNIVVSKYNNGVISGTFSLMKSASADGPWIQFKSWTIKYGTN